MNARTAAILFLAAVLSGCMATAPPDAGPASPADPRSPLGSPFSDRAVGLNDLGTPLVLDRADLSLGTTVQFHRLPTVSELHDAEQLPGLAHIVLTLPYWPDDLEALHALDMLQTETDVVVVLPGYPPNRAAAQAWNSINARLRIVAVVPGPPPSLAVTGDLNLMRGLERVIAQMDEPSRWGFERLQRPLSFRKVVE